MTFLIEYSPDAEAHLRRLTKRQQVIVLNAVDAQHIHEPFLETRNRKRMRPNPLAPWELRVGGLREYFDIEFEPVGRVSILAVGLKVGNRVRVGREEIEL